MGGTPLPPNPTSSASGPTIQESSCMHPQAWEVAGHLHAQQVPLMRNHSPLGVLPSDPQHTQPLHTSTPVPTTSLMHYANAPAPRAQPVVLRQWSDDSTGAHHPMPVRWP